MKPDGFEHDNAMAIVRELAGMTRGVIDHEGDCQFCQACLGYLPYSDRAGPVEKHAETCLWRRAKELVGG